MVAQADLRQGPAGRRTTGSRRTARAAAPALSDHELAQGYETVVDPSVYVRFPLTSGPLAGSAAPAGLDDDAVDARVEHRGRGAARTSPTSWPTDGTEVAGRRRAVAAPRSSATAGGDGVVRRHRAWSAGPTRGRSTWSTGRVGRRLADAHYVVLADYVTTDDGTGLVHQAPAFGADDLAVSPRATACRWSTRCGRTATSRRRPAGRRRCSSRTPTRRWCATSSERGLLFRHVAVRALVPALLALPHRAALLRAAVLVHPDDRGQGRAAGRERAHHLVPRDHQVGPVRRLAEQQHRLGAVPHPVLGHAAAGLAVRRGRTLTWCASGRWPSSASWPGRTCPPSTRTARTSTT